MDVSDFDFDLPESVIALRPAIPRDSARLLQVSGNGSFTDHSVRDLPGLLRKGDLLVLNDTKVLPAALSATRPARAVGGGGDVALTVNLHKRVSGNEWRAFIRPAKRLRNGDDVIFSETFSASVSEIASGGDVLLKFELSDADLDKAIEAHGVPPLPPYIARKRETDHKDKYDYQTIYAKDAGSVAAPTAGLHFTSDLFLALDSAGVQRTAVTLHVGAGTFLPVKSDRTEDHVMHSEWFEISDDAAEIINATKAAGKRIIAVGTTALRALESAAIDERVRSGSQDTDIFITPGYGFKIVDGLMTNFHLPKSTLFMLVSALAGRERMQAAYAYAIQSGYRFYSYGDSSLLWKAS